MNNIPVFSLLCLAIVGILASFGIFFLNIAKRFPRTERSFRTRRKWNATAMLAFAFALTFFIIALVFRN